MIQHQFGGGKIVYAWDGQASIMRTYTLEDTETLIGERKNTTYTWEMCQAKNKNGKKAGYYILGYNAIDTPYNKGYDVHASVMSARQIARTLIYQNVCKTKIMTIGS